MQEREQIGCHPRPPHSPLGAWESGVTKLSGWDDERFETRPERFRSPATASEVEADSPLAACERCYFGSGMGLPVRSTKVMLAKPASCSFTFA